MLKRFRQIIPGGLLLLASAGSAADAQSDYELGKKAFHNDDLVVAMQHLERAARNDHVEAMLLLGYILDQAEENEAALGHYHRAFDLGSAEAAMALGTMHASGDGVEKSADRAVDWYRKAADMGSSEAMSTLGQAHLNGELGLSVDRNAGYALLERAAAAGHEPARRLLEDAAGQGVN